MQISTKCVTSGLDLGYGNLKAVGGLAGSRDGVNAD